jgi:hypothetical protein
MAADLAFQTPIQTFFAGFKGWGQYPKQCEDQALHAHTNLLQIFCTEANPVGCQLQVGAINGG